MPTEPWPKPGELIFHDCRTAASEKQKNKTTSNDSAGPKHPGSLRVVQWNIERGYKLDAVVEELKRLDADIISVQEIDIGCERSGSVDTGLAIAKALSMNYVFLCEFEELHSPLRDKSSQGGGIHGNGFFTRFDFKEVRVVEHTHHPIDWEAPCHPLAKKEPRHGRRLTLAATIATPAGDLLCYNCHLEVFCGIIGRMLQFADVFRDARQHAAATPHMAILADLNTMANGVARLSPNYCCDKMRLWSLGWSEGEYWERFLFGVKEDPSAPQPQLNPHLLRLGLGEQAAQDLVNPGFQDPFSARRDVTLDNPAYRLPWFLGGWGLMTGKLDWALLRGPIRVLDKRMGNDDYSRSDHRWLLVDVELLQP